MARVMNHFARLAAEDESPLAPLSTEEMKSACLAAGLWAYQSDAEHACPSCSPSFSMESNGHWICDHAQFRMIANWSVPFGAEHSADECVGNCSVHPLLSGDMLLCSIADRIGKGWGDLADEQGWHSASLGPSMDQLLTAAHAENTRKIADLAAFKVKRIAAAKQSEKMYDRRSGRPMPCRNFCHNGVLGKPEPATEVFPEGCRGHLSGTACTISKDGVARFFFHPDEPEWKVITGEVAFVPPPAPQATRWDALRSPQGSQGQQGMQSRPSSAGSVQSRPSSASAPQSRPCCTNPVCMNAGKANTHSTEKCGMPGGAAYRGRR
jgi:hypothetical protein